MALLPRIAGNARLAASFWGAAVLLVLLQGVLRWQAAREGRRLSSRFLPMRVHYVQAAMQGCVYAYWGWYWREVYDHVPLIAAQLAFAYGLDMVVSWLRRDEWILGFGPFPIIFSTNLFMWFRDDWFFLQLAMVATGVLGKEFIKWTRDERRVHVFNPSALSLSLFSVALIATHSTGITWGPDIAATLGLPPRIYLEIFLVGLVVQVLFSVTLVTLAAAAALCALGLAYTGATGTYHFLMTNIPISIFLGLHLLVTDPATSPRTTLGRILFGGLYGAAAFALFGLLAQIGAPTFYDKLLPVPVLNLTVPFLDRVSRKLAERVPALEPTALWRPDRVNLSAVAVWVALFAVMLGSSFVGGTKHPGRDPEFWQRACEEGRYNGCRTWVTFLELGCERDPAACNQLGHAVYEGRGVERSLLQAGKSFARACDGGLESGCDSLREFVSSTGPGPFQQACDSGEEASCFILGELYWNGFGVPADEAAALALYQRLCAKGWARGCGRLGDSYLLGKGAETDPTKARASFDEGCAAGDPASCDTVANLYDRGLGGPESHEMAKQRWRRACALGRRSACAQGGAATAGPVEDPALDVLRLGG